MTFVVVKFLEDDSIDFVPEKWVRGRSLCYWPKVNVSKLRKECVEVDDEDEKWTLFDIKIYDYASKYSNAGLK
jgi:hypothetical protein